MLSIDVINRLSALLCGRLSESPFSLMPIQLLSSQWDPMANKIIQIIVAPINTNSQTEQSAARAHQGEWTRCSNRHPEGHPCILGSLDRDRVSKMGLAQQLWRTQKRRGQWLTRGQFNATQRHNLDELRSIDIARQKHQKIHDGCGLQSRTGSHYVVKVFIINL